MKKRDKNNPDQESGRHDILNELRRIPRAQTDDDFLEKLHLKLGIEEQPSEQKNERGFFDYIYELMTSRLTITAAGLSAAMLLIYIIIPKENENLISEKEKTDINSSVTQTDTVQKNTNSQSGLTSGTDSNKSQDNFAFKDPKEIIPEVIKQTKKGIQKIKSGKFRKDSPYVSSINISLNKVQLEDLRQKIISNAASESEIFRKKIEDLKSGWLESLKEKVELEGK